MNTHYTHQQGFSAIIAVAIIAIISVGGYIAVSATQNSRIERAEQQALVSVKDQVRARLTNVQAILESDIEAGAKIEASTALTAKIKNLIAQAQISMSANSRSELTAMQNTVAQIEAEIRSDVEASASAVASAIAQLGTGGGTTMIDNWAEPIRSTESGDEAGTNANIDAQATTAVDAELNDALDASVDSNIEAGVDAVIN